MHYTKAIVIWVCKICCFDNVIHASSSFTHNNLKAQAVFEHTITSENELTMKVIQIKQEKKVLITKTKINIWKNQQFHLQTDKRDEY